MESSSTLYLSCENRCAAIDQNTASAVDRNTCYSIATNKSIVITPTWYCCHAEQKRLSRFYEPYSPRLENSLSHRYSKKVCASLCGVVFVQLSSHAMSRFRLTSDLDRQKRERENLLRIVFTGFFCKPSDIRKLT
jgi:hypothetical protein